MNLSRAYTLAYGDELSVGRVQTPTLAMLAERELAVRSFVPAFRVMSDRVLLAIAENEPATAAELLAIPGIGIKLVEKYAAQIYRILDESRV
jgi:DNA topoisomerase IA